MVRPILTACLCLVAALAVLPAQARTAQLRAAKVATPVATLERVRARLDWADGADAGELQLWAGRVEAPDLGYRFRDLHWRCPLRRTANAGWRCEGELRAGNAAPLRLAVAFDAATTRASLAKGAARIALDRNAASPDLTAFDLRGVPLAWAQALLAQAWPQGHLKAGTADGRLQVASTRGGLRVEGALRLRGAGFESADASIVGEDLGGELRLDYRSAAASTQATVEGELRGGEFLAGNSYVALPATPVGLRIEANRQGGAGWALPRIEWRDGGVLTADASARLAPDGTLAALDVRARSDDMAPLRPRYLSGWLGLVGLGEVELRGAMEVEAHLDATGLTGASALLHGVDLRDPAGRFGFDGLRGDLRYSAGAEPVASALEWKAGRLHGLAFGAARLPFASAGGELRVREAVQVPLMGGTLGLRDVVIRPPQGDAGADIRFGLRLSDIDFGKVSEALGLPPFQGRLGGDIPLARYADDRIEFDGGLTLGIFDGRVAFSSLALERPFGTAPSLSADIAMDDLDLLRLTEVLGFGSITGRLDGRIDGLRLVDWTPVAFDASFVTDPAPGVRQRISQRAVQNISSVGDASFITSLQGRLIGLFSDFGYRRIGIGCRLENEVCAMSGLHSAGNAFTIVEGKGIPRLGVVGYNRAVNWPTLVERLVAVGKGDVAPVVE
jgi:hypothetical protein